MHAATRIHVQFFNNGICEKMGIIAKLSHINIKKLIKM
jgi:hypothetical protein